MASSLLDTNIISQPIKRKPHEAALRWMLSTPREDAFLSVVTIQETRTGIELLKDGEKKERLEAWFRRTRRRFAGRILPVSEEVADRCGYLIAQLRANREFVDTNDVLLAATAYVHGLQVVTLNRKDFEPLAKLGVTVVEL